ncbi:MAG TPA: hypothetical protein VFC42_04410 [Methylomirabilota bacterium]|nr:hypothetical protein [Methylomirabilota bacterium]
MRALAALFQSRPRPNGGPPEPCKASGDTPPWGRIGPALGAIAAGSLCVLAVLFLVRSRPFVGGVDFLDYALYSRDLASNVPDVPRARYVFFPGVYVFWSSVIRWFGVDLAPLQRAHIGVLAVDAALIVAIAHAITRKVGLSLIAAPGYVFVAWRLEGLAGTTEPLGTIPFLGGLYCWVLARRADRPLLANALLGFGLGLTLFMKQQGGLLWLGILGLLAERRGGRGARSRMLSLPMLSLVACGTFLASMAIEGGGIAALRAGIEKAVSYPARGSPLENLLQALDRCGPFGPLLGLGAGLWVVMLCRRNGDAKTECFASTLGVTVFSAIGALLQYWTRPYLHYALYALPSLVMTGVLAVYRIQLALQDWASSRILRHSLGALIASLLVLASGEVLADAVVISGWPSGSTFQAMLERRYAPLCRYVRAGEDVLLIPSRQNGFHWVCRTRAIRRRWGYGFNLDNNRVENVLHTLEQTPYRSVVVVDANLSWFERTVFSHGDWRPVTLLLSRRGFRAVAHTDAATLYQRPTS